MHLEDALMLKQGAVGEQIAQRSTLTSVFFVQSEADACMSVDSAYGSEEDRALFHV